MARLLVVTPIKETWGNEKEVVFLGEWCKLYSCKESWDNLNHSVIPYHWDDRNKLEKDYHYLIDLYEKLLKKISINMNSIHQVNFNDRYWRILLGPWLGLLIQSVFDRWEMIQLAVNSNEKLQSNIISKSALIWTPYNYSDFKKLVTDSDGWNNFIYSKIIELHHKKIHINKINSKNFNRRMVNSKNKNFKIFLLTIYQSIVNFINPNKSSLIISSYLNIIDETFLSLRLSQLPLFINVQKPKQYKPNKDQRGWELDLDTSSSFEKFIIKLIPDQIPSIYLEGYNHLHKKVKKLSWPKSPKSIFTSNSIHEDDIFKHYTGINSEAPLVIGQHGGNYGISKLFFQEYHELSIADKYVSWGWTDTSFKSKIYPLGQLNSKSFKKSNSKKTKLLLVTCVIPRYSYVMSSIVISSQWLSYFKNQIEFVKNLDESISNKTTVRLYRHDYGWEQEERWREKFPDLNYDNGSSNLETLFNETKLYVATYNATTFLETFRLNIPTVIFWDPNYWENRDSVKNLFNELKRVKVFHDSPESASKHINEIWDDVEVWWRSSEVTEVINKFNQSINRNNENLNSDLFKILNN